jgi:hypothetical protein
MKLAAISATANRISTPLGIGSAGTNWPTMEPSEIWLKPGVVLK